MPTYIMLSTLTPEGVQTVKNNPQRIREVNKEVEQLGATVKAQWATLGHVDFISVVEAPDEGDDGARLARARLARHRPLRDARGDPRRGLHRVAVAPVAARLRRVRAQLQYDEARELAGRSRFALHEDALVGGAVECDRAGR